MDTTRVYCAENSSRCKGNMLPGTNKCWAHADAPALDAALKRLGEDGRLDARGVQVTQVLLQRLLAAAPRDENDRPVLRYASFKEAVFHGSARFDKVIFQGDAMFDEATFLGEALFAGTAFHGDASFSQVAFRDVAVFEWAAFHGPADFHKTSFAGTAYYRQAQFQSYALFFGAKFQADAWFAQASFRGVFEFANVVIGGDALFTGAVFDEARQIGPLLVLCQAMDIRALVPEIRGLVLDRAQFRQPVRIESSTPYLLCRRARFAGGAQFHLRWTQAVFTGTEFAGPSMIAGISRLSGSLFGPMAEDTELVKAEEVAVREWERELPTVSERPQLFSLQHAVVGALSLSGIDVSECRFAGAHNLDGLRMEPGVTMTIAPVWLRWERRDVIAEERTLRRRRSRRWTAPAWPEWAGEPPAVLEAAQVAELYRALRKGREDSTDTPGAADFYYGEMEMRRHSRARPAATRPGNAPRGQVERGTLTVYWLMSGYGLRAWRALAWLAAVLAGFAVMFRLAGFTTPPQPSSYFTSLLYAFRATVSLTDDDVKLTAWGRLLQALLRITGPVLLGLALLAFRNRVKR
jgi:uncharacterized protein YjbI with pentapeptide repeats